MALVGYSNSDALGDDHLNDGNGVLVGVRDGVVSAGGADALDEVIVAPTLEQIMDIKHNRDLSEKVQDCQIANLYKQ